jgi:glycolate oxidase iron-sulfur subunit
MSASPPAARAFPLAKADQCVKCGICLPHCPTYLVTQNEGDSPRGRIMLMQGLATGMVGAEPALLAHLDGCLTCRACEAVCPAEVPYGTLIDSVREVLQEIHPARSRIPRLMALILVNKPLRFLAAALLWLYQRLGVQWLVRESRVLGRGRLARLESLLPEIHLPRVPAPMAGGPQTVALFANCTSPLAEPETLRAAVRLLARVGCNVTVPKGQTCCGALHQHAGLAHSAKGCAQENLRAFANADAVIGIASGCTAQLLDYGEMLAGEDAGAFARKNFDLHGFLAKHPQRARLRFKALPARVLLHTPCTLRNVLKDAAPVRELLGMIPQLNVQSLGYGLEGGCCGAAGSYFLTQPEMADRLLKPLLERIQREAPGYVLSSNIGCSMHLAAGLRRAGLRIPVWHPARLLALQLDD